MKNRRRKSSFFECCNMESGKISGFSNTFYFLWFRVDCQFWNILANSNFFLLSHNHCLLHHSGLLSTIPVHAFNFSWCLDCIRCWRSGRLFLELYQLLLIRFIIWLASYPLYLSYDVYYSTSRQLSIHFELYTFFHLKHDEL